MRIELTAIKGAASHSHLDVISSIWRHLENEAKASQNINTNFLAITYTHRHIIQKNWISVLIFVSSYKKQHSLDKSKKLFSRFQSYSYSRDLHNAAPRTVLMTKISWKVLHNPALHEALVLSSCPNKICNLNTECVIPPSAEMFVDLSQP